MESPHRDSGAPDRRTKETSGRPAAGSGRASPGGSPYRLVAIAASAGGIKAVGDLLSALPADFPLPIAVVLHRTARPPYLLDKVLGRRTPLTVKAAGADEAMRPGTVYLAPPDLHLQVRDNAFALTDGRKIRHVRSSANPLFASAAEALGGRLIAVVLTGHGRDATDGVQAVKARGGVVIAQDEARSQSHSMPRSTQPVSIADRVLPLEQIAPAIVELATAHRRDGHGSAGEAPGQA